MPRGTSEGSKNTQFKKGNIPWNKGLKLDPIIEATKGLETGFLNPLTTIDKKNEINKKSSKYIIDVNKGFIDKDSSVSNISFISEINEVNETKAGIEEVNKLIQTYIDNDKKLSKESIDSVSKLKNKISELIKNLETIKKSDKISTNLLDSFNSSLYSFEMFSENVEANMRKILDNINQGNDTEKDNSNELYFINEGITSLKDNLKNIEKVISKIPESQEKFDFIKELDNLIKTVSVPQEKIKEKETNKKEFKKQVEEQELENKVLLLDSILDGINESLYDARSNISEFSEKIKSKQLFNAIEASFTSIFKGSGKNKKKLEGISDLFNSLNSIQNDILEFEKRGLPITDSRISKFESDINLVVDKLNAILESSKYVKDKRAAADVSNLQKYLNNIISNLKLASDKVKGSRVTEKFTKTTVQNIDEGNITVLQNLYQDILDKINSINKTEKEFREKSKKYVFESEVEYSEAFNEGILSNLKEMFERYEERRAEVSSVSENKENFNDLIDNVKALKEIAEDNYDLFEEIDKEFLDKKLPELIKTLNKSQSFKEKRPSFKSMSVSVLEKLTDITDIPLFSMLASPISKAMEREEKQKEIKRKLIGNIPESVFSKKSTENIEETKEESIEQSKDTKFKKGNVPWNKGFKFREETKKDKLIDTIKNPVLKSGLIGTLMGGLTGAATGSMLGGPVAGSLVGGATGVMVATLKYIKEKLDEIEENQDDSMKADDKRDKKNNLLKLFSNKASALSKIPQIASMIGFMKNPDFIAGLISTALLAMGAL
jgi:hypothetical protein